jgi:two-component system, chemotaxis family, CheB/CheR fusion protein
MYSMGQSALKIGDALPPAMRPDPRFLNAGIEGSLRAIFKLLLRWKQADFSLYRRSGILRAMASRMNLFHLQDPREYVRLLSQDHAELERLYERILIKTTNFFRDPSAFEALQRKALKPLIRRHSTPGPIRVWVVGCSTGEEAYTVAMCLVESAEAVGKPVSFQILATDISDAALRKARLGEYSPRMVEGVSPGRLERFFLKCAGGYRIKRDLRWSCIFSRHNLVQTIPFSRMDLVTCRNVLIYMERELQRKALSKLRYALKPGGLLMLGSTESVLGSPGWGIVDPKHRIFRRL